MIPIYIMKRVPGADVWQAMSQGGATVTEWEKVCHSPEPFITIHHFPRRDTSRWVSVERKKPFVIWYNRGRNRGHSEISWHASLDSAVRSAIAFRKGQIASAKMAREAKA